MAPDELSSLKRGIERAPQPAALKDPVPFGYAVLLEDIKERVRASQVRAALAINRELILLYWDIGRTIVERQRAEGWGKSIVDRLANDLQVEFPGIAGFSPANIWRMRALYLAWTEEVLAQPVRESGKRSNLAQPVSDLGQITPPAEVEGIPWGHNISLLEKLKHPIERQWYAQKTLEHGWSRAVLVHQIESNLIGRQGSAITNFQATLPAPQSDLAQQLLKDPYTFDFLTISDAAQERHLELGLTDHIMEFLIELGVGFAFVGRQVHLEVGGDDFYIDLLFYHLQLRCYLVIDLKMEKFKPEFAGNMNFYLSAVDDLMRQGDDQPAIGLILCKDKNRVVVEYALRDSSKPIGVSEYILTERLPERLKGSLPTVEQLESEFSTELEDMC